MAKDYGLINQQFQSILGRPASQDELDFFGKFLDEGSLQHEEIGQVIQSLPEGQRKQLAADTSAYGAKLNEQNAAILDQAGASAASRFAGLGRPQTSALGASVMQAGGQLAQARQSALADFYGQGLKQASGSGISLGENALSRGYGLRDETRKRGYEIQDYYRQKNDYEDAKNASSGWNAITPEFVTGQVLGAAGKAGAAYLGGYGGARGAAGKRLF